MKDSWHISKASFLADFWLIPTYFVAIWWYTAPNTNSFFVSYVTILSGWAFWTLAEYWIHRSIYHRFYRREHWEHHINPSSWIGVPPWVSGGALLAAWLVFTRFGINWGTDFWCGFACGYYEYILVHTLIHHSDTALFADHRRRHDYHHEGDEKNFGVTTAFWDHIFGTYHAV